MAATTLNPNAPFFFPATAFSGAGELFPIQQTSPVFVKGTIFFHPSLFYHHFSLSPNFSHYIPPPKYSIIPTTAIEEFAGERDREEEEQSVRTVTSYRNSIRGFRGQFEGRRMIKRQSSQFWVRKTSNDVQLVKDSIFPVVEDLQFGDGEKSTVMIKNIPNKMSRKQIIDLLDQHCLIENQKNMEEIPLSEFDFLYLPMDFISGNNLGYAFVNFTTPSAAKKLHQKMHLKPWIEFGSRKTCEITQAKIQGLEELVKHFKRSIFNCSSSDYLPVLFQPSRNGSRNSPQQIVGKLVLKQ